ncbi:MAG TPA: hypothetical protein PLE50_00635 [Rhabdaerophilum sp.]|nr:hypothetical protein [Rhabdaerophilum sp.]
MKFVRGSLLSGSAFAWPGCMPGSSGRSPVSAISSDREGGNGRLADSGGSVRTAGCGAAEAVARGRTGSAFGIIGASGARIDAAAGARDWFSISPRRETIVSSVACRASSVVRVRFSASLWALLNSLRSRLISSRPSAASVSPVSSRGALRRASCAAFIAAVSAVSRMSCRAMSIWLSRSEKLRSSPSNPGELLATRSMRWASPAISPCRLSSAVESLRAF